MKPENMEKKLREAKFHHLTEEELDSYYNKKLGAIRQTIAEAHLRLCLICEQQLKLLEEESAKSENREVTADDVAMVRRIMKQMELKQQPADPRPPLSANVVSLDDRFADNLQQITESWQSYFIERKSVRPASRSGETIWQGESSDGSMKAHATLGKDASLTIHFSSDDLSLEGHRLDVNIGSMRREITLQLVSESEVYTKVKITRNQLPLNLADIKITPIS